MLPAIVATVRSKVPGGLPALVSWVLGTLVAGQSVLFGQQLLMLARGDSESRRAGGTDNPPMPTARAHDINVAGLMAAHLFGDPATPPVYANAADVPASASSLVLTGTLAARNPKQGMAIISSDGKSTFYKVGAALEGAIVSSVYADRVILDRGGTLEALILPHGKPVLETSASSQTQVATAAQSSDSSGLVADNAGTIAEVMRAGGPIMNEDGHMRGFRIYPGKDRATFVASGLQGGDVVVAFNGASVIDQNRRSGQEVFRTFGTSARTTLTIERDGATRDIVVDLAQAGSSMRPAFPGNTSVGSSAQ
jgi:general secretion pathway protein C